MSLNRYNRVYLPLIILEPFPEKYLKCQFTIKIVLAFAFGRITKFIELLEIGFINLLIMNLLVFE